MVVLHHVCHICRVEYRIGRHSVPRLGYAELVGYPDLVVKAILQPTRANVPFLSYHLVSFV